MTKFDQLEALKELVGEMVEIMETEIAIGNLRLPEADMDWLTRAQKVLGGIQP